MKKKKILRSKSISKPIQKSNCVDKSSFYTLFHIIYALIFSIINMFARFTIPYNLEGKSFGYIENLIVFFNHYLWPMMGHYMSICYYISVYIDDRKNNYNDIGFRSIFDSYGIHLIFI